jgi:intracellular septation protein
MQFLQAFKPIGLDLLATIIFVATYWLTGDILAATATGIVAGVARFAYIKIKKQPVGPLQYLSVVLVVVAGVSTLVTKDPHFVMIKSSVVFLAVAAVMLRTNWMAPYLPAIVTDNLDPTVILWASRGWGLLLIALAVANAVVAFGFSIDVWVWYASIVPTAAQLLAFALQYAIFRTLVRRNVRAKQTAQPA